MNSDVSPEIGDHSASERNIAYGLAKIGLALRSMMWARGQSSGLTPTQSQILELLVTRGALRLSAIAMNLGVRQPTTTEAVNTLVRKGLIDKHGDPGDRRAIVLGLTEKGRAAAKRSETWSNTMVRAIGELNGADQSALLRALTKLLHMLHLNGDAALARACVSCRFFRPHIGATRDTAHHCEALKSSFGDHALRLDCGVYETASREQVNDNWRRFTAGSATLTETP